jgi:hypothetical protein
MISRQSTGSSGAMAFTTTSRMRCTPSALSRSRSS